MTKFNAKSDEAFLEELFILERSETEIPSQDLLANILADASSCMTQKDMKRSQKPKLWETFFSWATTLRLPLALTASAIMGIYLGYNEHIPPLSTEALQSEYEVFVSDVDDYIPTEIQFEDLL